jgi:hypothetical protein
MAKFTGKSNFTNGDAVTAAALNEITTTLLLGQDSFTTSSLTVTAGVVSVTPGGIVRADLEDSSDANTGINAAKITDGAITTAKLPDSTSTTTGVTYAKMQFVENSDNVGRVLGRKTNGDGAVEEFLLDTLLTTVSSSDDTIASAKAIGAMYGSVNAIVPSAIVSGTKTISLTNGLIVKFGTKTRDADLTTIDLSSESSDFPNQVYAAFATGQDADATVGTALAATIKTASVSEIIVATDAAVDTIHYLAIGR